MLLSKETLALVKRLVALGGMVAALVLAVKVEPATAAPCRQVFRDFYWEPELINWCGYRYNVCTQIVFGGCRTDFFTNEVGDCCDNGNDPGGPLCDCD